MTEAKQDSAYTTKRIGEDIGKPLELRIKTQYYTGTKTPEVVSTAYYIPGEISNCGQTVELFDKDGKITQRTIVTEARLNVREGRPNENVETTTVFWPGTEVLRSEREVKRTPDWKTRISDRTTLYDESGREVNTVYAPVSE